MPGTGARPALAQAANGVVTPLYADRSVLRAEDLTLDRDSSDAELARVRRLLHGWGVVAGLVPVLRQDELVVTPGYAVTPSGEELWLPDPLTVDRVAARVVACCGPDRQDCELPDEDELRDDPDDPDAPVSAWLVARAVHSETAPRAGAPVGCEHPASHLRPSRRCDGVALELRCTLPDSLQVTPPTCEELSPLVCGSRSRRLASFDLPLLPSTEDDVVVLGHLRVRDGVATESYRDRRHLLPLSVLQAWMAACVCPLLQRPDSDDQEDPREDEGGGRRQGKDGWTVLADRLRANGFDLGRRPVRGRPRGPSVLLEPQVLAALQSGGIEGPEAFLAAEPAVLSGLTALSVDAVVEAQSELVQLRTFFRRSG